MRKFVFLLAIFCFAGSVTFAQGTKADYDRANNWRNLSRNKVFKTRVDAHWFADNSKFWYRNDLLAGAREFILVNANASKRTMAFDHSRLAKSLAKASGKTVRGERLPFTKIVFNDDASTVWFSAFGKTWQCDLTDYEIESSTFPKREPATADTNPKERRPRRTGGNSPDGDWVAFTKDHNVFLRNKSSNEVVALTKDGDESHAYHGPIYWSPDSQKFVAMRTKRGFQRKVTLVEAAPRDQLQPKLRSYTYRKPGDAIPLTKPQLFHAKEKTQVAVDDSLHSNPWEIDDLNWDADSSQFSFVYNPRGHKLLRLVGVDADTGESKTLIEESSGKFFDYAYKKFYKRIEAAGEAIWMSERSGWNHFYLHDFKTGELKNAITTGDWVVKSVARVDEMNRQIWFWACGVFPEQDPYYVHFGRVNFDGTGLVFLTRGDGTHKIKLSPDGRFLIDTYSKVDMPPVTELRSAVTGALICELERADISELQKTSWLPPERFVAKGRDGETDIHGVVWKPSNFEPSRSYPIIERIYAGPHDAYTPKAFTPFYNSQCLAELGFVVVMLDGMGTNWRSREFHEVCWKNLGDSGFPDRILWIKKLAKKYPNLDLKRVGIYGGSAGGQSALRGMLAHGDFYKAAAADCGCHDNRMDKIWWNEAWMGWPIGPNYEEQSNVTNAHKLTGKLLLTVGSLDTNVDPSSTMQVVEALIKADKDFELIVFPSGGHGIGDSSYGKRRRRDFFVRHLLGVKPRGE